MLPNIALFPYAIIVLCLIIVVLFHFTKEYDSPIGIVLVLCALGAIVFRTWALSFIPSFLFLPQTFAQSAICTILATILAVIVVSWKRKRAHKNHVALLFTLYLILGFGQQLLFQYVFLETLYFLTGNSITAITISVLYFSLFHTKRGLCFYTQAIMAETLWSSIYLYFGNIIPLAISHGIVGTMYYTSDAIAERSKLLRKHLLH